MASSIYHFFWYASQTPALPDGYIETQAIIALVLPKTARFSSVYGFYLQYVVMISMGYC